MFSVINDVVTRSCKIQQMKELARRIAAVKMSGAIL